MAVDDVQLEAIYLRVVELEEVLRPLVLSRRTRVVAGALVEDDGARTPSTEAAEFIAATLSFARGYARRSDGVVAHCIALVIVELLKRKHPDIAKGLADAACDQSEFSKWFERLLDEEASVDEVLRSLAKGGGLKVFGEPAYRNMRRAKKRVYRDFSAYLRSREDIDSRTREKYAAWFAAFVVGINAIPGAALAHDALGRAFVGHAHKAGLSKPIVVFVGAAGLALALLSAPALRDPATLRWPVRSARPKVNPGVQASTRHGSSATTVSDGAEESAAEVSERCTKLGVGFDIKKCLIEAGFLALKADKLTNALELLTRATKTTYDSRGFGDLALGDMGEVPERNLGMWQDVDAYEGIAAAQSLLLRHREAFDAARTMMRLHDRAYSPTSYALVSKEEACLVVLALARRAGLVQAGRDSAGTCNLLGGRVDDLIRYENALGDAALGHLEEALTGLAPLRGVSLTDPEGRTALKRVEPRPYWAHLLPPDPDLFRSFDGLVDQLQRRGKAIVVDGLLVWSVPDGTGDRGHMVGVTPLAPRLKPCGDLATSQTLTVDARGLELIQPHEQGRTSLSSVTSGPVWGGGTAGAEPTVSIGIDATFSRDRSSCAHWSFDLCLDNVSGTFAMGPCE